MSLEDIPIRDPAALSLAERDLEALTLTSQAAFRFERAQLRFEVALKNGLGERETAQIRALAGDGPPLGSWRRKVALLWTSTGWRFTTRSRT